MAKNQRYTHNLHISVTAPRAVKSGDPVVVGAYAGVAKFDAKSGEKVTIWLDGSYMIPVEGAVTAYALVYAKADGTLTSTATGNRAFGIANEAKAAAAVAPVEVAPLGRLQSVAAGA